MHLNPREWLAWPGRLASAVPAGPWQTAALWLPGLGLGAAAALGDVALPLPWAAAGWGALLAVGVGLAWRGEPVVVREAPAPVEGEAPTPVADEAPSPPPVPMATPLPVAEPSPSSLLDMVPIEGGTFWMGSAPASEEELRGYAADWAAASGGDPSEHMRDVRPRLRREQAAQPVQVDPFLIARLPVTRGQWRAVMEEEPHEWEWELDALPATHLDWQQALAFCNVLSRREGLTPCYQHKGGQKWSWERSTDGYRLPTEAEWEYACRAGTAGRWFWGDAPARTGEYAWYRENADNQLHPAGAKAPNPWGLHDMVGLVWEWCWDRYGPYGEPAGPPLENPAGAESGSLRVVRGGSFRGTPGDLRSANRFGGSPEDRVDDLSLRCVRSRVRQP